MWTQRPSRLAWCVVCLQLSLGVAALFGPQSRSLSRHVDCISSRLEIPHVITAAVEWSPRPGQWTDDRLFTVNVHPAGRQLSRAYVDLIRLFQWNSFCVLFTNSRGEYCYLTLFLYAGILRLPCVIFMAALRSRSRCRHYIFALSFLYFYLFSSTNLNIHRLDVCHTSAHGVALVRI